MLEKFENVKVLVVGDVMLDRYWWGNVKRISPEAPVPVVNLERTSVVAGGAANVAANVAGLGATPVLCGVIGRDDESKLFTDILKKAYVSPEHLIAVENRPTTIKTRIVAHSQHVVRIDQEFSGKIDEATEEKIYKRAENLMAEISAVIISDYAKGVLTENVLMRLITTAKSSNIPILVDPKGKNYQKYSGATLITPNKSEAANACGLDEEDHETIDSAGRSLLESLSLQAVLITQGEKGMTLFREKSDPVHMPALARNVYDVTGAGDTVIACLGTAVGAGYDLEKAAQLANVAAGLVVEEVGTTVIDREKLHSFLTEQAHASAK